jgi:hypothetical protein
MTAPTLNVQLPLFDATPDPETESDGLTLDTAHGPVDLVAVERAMAGERLHLTRAERRYIADLLDRHLSPRKGD